MCLCYSCLKTNIWSFCGWWWENAQERASEHFSAWLAIWFPVSLLFYLLPAETQHPFCMEPHKPCLYNKYPFLKIVFWLCLLTPFCVCMYEKSSEKKMFSQGNISAFTGLRTAQKKKPTKKQNTNHTDFTCIRNKHSNNSCQQAFLSLPSNTHSNLLPLPSNIPTTSFFLVNAQELKQQFLLVVASTTVPELVHGMNRIPSIFLLLLLLF